MTLSRLITYRTSLVLLTYIAFISLGLPDGLLGVAWPSMKNNFERSLDSLGILLSASTAGYLLSSFYGGHLLTRMGVGWLLSLSCGVTGASLLGYTFVPAWWMLIPLAMSAGLGAGAIDSGINTYAAAHFSKRSMQWLHASFGIGITLGPIIMTFGINYYSSWRWGYVLVGIAQLLLALIFGATVKIWNHNSYPGVIEERRITDYKTPILKTLMQFKVWISILMFFVYAGIEASVGSWTYTLLTESRAIPAEIAGFWVGSYWAAFTIGRVLAGLFSAKISMHGLIYISLLVALFGAILLIWNPTEISSLVGLALIGISIAPVFPGMVSLTSKRVSPQFTANTIGMQISAAGLGVAVIPGLTGVAAQRTSLEIIPFVIISSIMLLLVIYMLASHLEKRV